MLLVTATVTLTLHCRHCNKQFTAKRKSAKFCSDACKAKAFRANRASEILSALKRTNRHKEKLKKLARSTYGRWLVGLLQRSGTVQVLQGAKSSDLQQLADLKAACNKANGYKKPHTYEISHIYPVDGKLGVGRLLADNLVISPVSYNRQRTNTSPDTNDERFYIAYEDIQKRFLVDRTTKSHVVLSRLQRMMGPEFSKWLKSYQIRPTQRDQLLKKIKTHDPSLKVTRNASLDELKALAIEKKVNVYELDVNVEEPQQVAFEELARAGKAGSTPYKALKFWVDSQLGPDLPPLPEGFWLFVMQQAMELLHGGESMETYEGRPLLDYLVRSP